MQTARKIALALALSGLAVGGLAPSLGASIAAAQHEEAGHEAAPEGDAHAAEGHVAAEGHGEEGHGEAHAPEWNYFQFAGQLTNFALWLGIIYFLLNRMLPKFLADRRAGIVDGLEEAKRMKAQAEAKYEEYSKRIDTMDEELARVREDMKKAGLGERDRLVKDAAEKAERMHADARFLVQQQMKQLKEELTREAIEAAVSAADRILRERTTPADQQRLADEYLGRIKTTVSSTQKPSTSGAQS